MPANDDIKEKIAVISIKGKGPVDVLYVGGSSFELQFRNGDSPVRCRKQAIDTLISRKQIKIIAPKRYKEICDAILPDGSTATRNADGTVKTERSKIRGVLENEGYIEKKAPATYELFDELEEHNDKTDISGTPPIADVSNLFAKLDNDATNSLPHANHNKINLKDTDSSVKHEPSAPLPDTRTEQPSSNAVESPTESGIENVSVPENAHVQLPESEEAELLPTITPEDAENEKTSDDGTKPNSKKKNKKEGPPKGKPYHGQHHRRHVIVGTANDSDDDSIEPEDASNAELMPSQNTDSGKQLSEPLDEQDEENSDFEEDKEDSDEEDNSASAPIAEKNTENLEQAQRLEGDLNGDGFVDIFDDLFREEKRDATKYDIMAGVIAIFSFVLLFAVHSIAATVIGEHTLQSPLTAVETTAQNTNGVGDLISQLLGNGKQNTNNNVSNQNGNGTSQLATASGRTDFDPESYVASYSLAPDDKQNIVIGLFQTIRSDILNGDANGFNSIVSLDGISNSLATAYSEYAAQKQGLSASEKTDLYNIYKSTFKIRELQHVTDKDVYASMLGGRLREVRLDPSDQYKMYAVMESIAGDHQRVCFVIQGDQSGRWAVTDITDPQGYVKMISEGTV